MNPPILDRLERDLEKRKSEFLFRSIPLYKSETHIDLSTNSYLDLQNCSIVRIEAARLTAAQHFGNMASRLIRQASPLYEALEREIADWKHTESALVYNSGYAANVGVIQAICNRHTDIFSDRLNHASIIDGCTLSGGRLFRYRHNDMSDLERLLRESSSQDKVITTDTIFSMDGDRAPLEEICDLGRKYGCAVMVDEAHAAGIFGKTLSGLVEETGTADGIHIRIGTLSKAIAGLGGFFAGSKELRDFLVNSSRSLIYSTGLPHQVLAFNLASVRFIRQNPDLGVRLLQTADEFRSMLTSAGFDCMGSTSQIVPVAMSNSRAALELSAFLRKHNIFAPAIRPPTVPKGSERLRFSVHLGVQKSQLEQIVSCMQKWKH